MPDDNEIIATENARLRERNAQLESEVERMKESIRDASKDLSAWADKIARAGLFVGFTSDEPLQVIGDKARQMGIKANIADALLRLIDQKDVYFGREFFHDRAPEWYVAWRNGKAYRDKDFKEAMSAAIKEGP